MLFMRPRIAIVGANFAGLKAAQMLPRRYDVTVIDQSPWFEWLPNIHEIISGVKRPSDLRLPRRRVVAAAGHRFLRAKVVAIDPSAGHLHLAGGGKIFFEACIVAVGGVHDNSGVPGAERFALPFKGIEQCAVIGRKLRRLARGRAPLSIVIIGGGLEGIEALGEIVRRYRQRRDLSIVVVDKAKRLLPGAPAGLDRMIRRDCEGLPVRFALGSPVAEVREKSIRLNSGDTLPFDICIWSGGAAPPPLLYQSGLAEARKKWAKAQSTLQSARFDNVLLAGDAAELSPSLSKQAFYALQMGDHAADNVERLLSGKQLRDFPSETSIRFWSAPKPRSPARRWRL